MVNKSVTKPALERSIGFPPVATKDARILILGSLPGVQSLKQGQYYANRHNAFWEIMGELAGAAPDMLYEQKLKQLLAHRIALWDVCAVAIRPGSLDSAICDPQANDFVTFFKKYRGIEKILFNGQPAERLYRRLVLPNLPESMSDLPRVILPSTSPAHAALRFAAKLEHWRAALVDQVHA